VELFEFIISRIFVGELHGCPRVSLRALDADYAGSRSASLRGARRGAPHVAHLLASGVPVALPAHQPPLPHLHYSHGAEYLIYSSVLGANIFWDR
jgi:hypothetical protein